jgi:hypothetical protein
MGLFNDNVSAGRTSWTYKYTGGDLLPYATKLYHEYRAKEEESRNRMADFMKDMNVSNNDRRVEDTKREIISFGTLKEQCAVFKHEFARHPDKEYELGLGDVTFFGLV